jgi:hypothetical protein
VGQRAFAQGVKPHVPYTIWPWVRQKGEERKLEKGQKIKKFAKEHKWLIAAIIVIAILAYIIVVVV